jgi:hypothetical protein
MSYEMLVEGFLTDNVQQHSPELKLISNRVGNLSITHILRREQVADLDVGESGQAAPDYGVARRASPARARYPPSRAS